MWVDRTGAKVGITEQYSRNSKGTLALVAQVHWDFRVCLAANSLVSHSLQSLLAVILLYHSVLTTLLQEITSRDETGAPCTRGMRTTPFGQYVADGPPTGLSGGTSVLCSASSR